MICGIWILFSGWDLYDLALTHMFSFAVLYDLDISHMFAWVGSV